MKFEKKLPREKGETLILCSFIIYLIAGFAHTHMTLDPINLKYKAALTEWIIRGIRDLSITVSISTAIITGIKIIRI